MTPNRIMPTAITITNTAPKLRWNRMLRRMTGALLVNCESASRANPSSETRLSTTIIVDSNQRSRWPSSSTTVSADRPAVMPMMPSQSARSSPPQFDFSCGRPSSSKATRPAQIGTLMKKA